MNRPIGPEGAAASTSMSQILSKIIVDHQCMRAQQYAMFNIP